MFIYFVRKTNNFLVSGIAHYNIERKRILLKKL